MSLPLLQVRGLSVSLARSAAAEMAVLNDISFVLEKGQTLGIVGESGSGKSLLALAIIGLLPPLMRIRGRIDLDGLDLLSLDEDELCRVRGRRVGMIFQEPMTALNPAMTIGDQIAEGIVWHRGVSWCEGRREAVRLLEQVRISDAVSRARNYPHELSGGQRQRVGIAIALAAGPELLIADEPTTALDVTVQGEILDILAEHVRTGDMAMILVSHDLGVIARSCERMIVLYAGARMEEGPTRSVLERPDNPYTRGLLAAIPERRAGETRLAAIPGTVPGFSELPQGCRFSDRCPERIAACLAAEPHWQDLGEGRGVRCIRAGRGGEVLA